MSSYLLPSVKYIPDLDKHIVPTVSNNNKILINRTLHKYLSILKLKIDECEVAWDKFKKYTNPYEFIHSIIPNTRQSISTYKPLSRSFFKMIEMTHMLNILKELPHDKCKSFHLAEGPGGFIEALACLRKNKNDQYYGMTLLEDTNINIPGWRKSKSFLLENPNVIVEKGSDGKGDLMNSMNLIYCYKKYKGQFDLVTGDGGFDFSIHYLSQEMVSASLIISQISFALAMQKHGGTFIVKMFDTFSKVSLDILYLLSNIYDTVHFVKPHTSRYANSEKYIICKNFKINDSQRQNLINALFKLLITLQTMVTSKSENNIDSLFNFELPYYFIHKVEEYNAIFGQQQVENISTTLNLIANNKPDKLELLKKCNIQKCINWCKEYKIEYTSSVQSNNIFLSGKRNL
jgi:23S rRNA U2552 (ribose-2'-O)-methylase RlmE/FtsJ